MAFLPSETFSCSVSFHSGPHGRMPGHLMKASGPKEYLSIKAVISSQGLTSRSQSEVEAKQSFLLSLSLTLNDLECQNNNFQPSFEKKTCRLDNDVHEQGAENVASAGRNLTNVSQRGKSAGTNNLMEHYLPRTVCFCT